MSLERQSMAFAGAWSALAYKELRSRCVWKPQNLSVGTKSIPAHDAPQSAGQWRALKAWQCRLNADGDDGPAMLFIVRLGSVDGRPVQVQHGSWHSWQVHLELPKELASADHGVSLSSLHHWPVFEDGSYATWPPIHNHHSVLMGLGSAIKARTAWIGADVRAKQSAQSFLAMYKTGTGTSGSDSMYVDNDSAGIHKYFPPGHAWIVSDQFTANLLINDVRPRNATSGPLPTWYEVGYRIFKPLQRQMLREVHVVSYYMKPTQDWALRENNVGGVRWRNAPKTPEGYINKTCATFALPQHHPSVYVREQAWPAAGQIVGETWHSHHHFTDEGFVFRGSFSTLLDSLGYKNATYAPVALTKGSLESAKAAILQAVANSKDVELLCRYIPHRAKAVVEPGMLPQWYDRAARPAGGSCAVQGYRVRRGEVFSVACFNRVFVDVQELQSVQQPQQHCDWYAWFAPDKAKAHAH